MELANGSREAEAERIVNGFVGWSAGASLIPIPGADLVGVGLVQLKMLDELARHYNVPFSKNAAKSIIGALIGSSGAVLATMPVASIIKIVPLIGPVTSIFVEPSLAGASTWALGRVFVMHFESGGTFLDFDPEAMRKYYEEQNAAMRSGLKSSPAPKPAT